jgi:replication factor A1
MEIKDLQPKQGKVDIVVEIADKEEPREFTKFGMVGKVCNCKAKDSSGDIKLTLWNEQADQFNNGDKVQITNGYVSEYKGELQLSTGKYGKIEPLDGDAPDGEEAVTEEVAEEASEPTEAEEEALEEEPVEPAAE